MLLTLRALAGSAHLGPTLAVTTITVVLASASELELWRVTVMGAMTLANQLSIGWSNVAIDAARDREAHRRDKPIVRGEVSARTVMTLAIGAALTAVGLSVLLGLARADPRPAAAWAIAVGGMLGLAAHFANVLPDLSDDRRHGIRSLPHLLGARVSGAIALIALAAASVLAIVNAGIMTPVMMIGATATAVLLAAGVVTVVRRPTSRLLFRLIMLAALAVVVTLTGAAPAIVA